MNIEPLAELIASKINIPFIPEVGEVRGIEACLNVIYPALDKVLPESWVDIIQDITNGVDEEEAASYAVRLKQEIDSAIDLPESLEWLDDIFIDAVVDALGLALMRGFKL